VHVAQPAAYLEDLMLVDRCLDGEQAAARELFRRQRGRVQATLYRILGSNRDMDDLLQETFIQIFRSLDSFRGEARLSTWIDRIAVRVAYRYLSGKKRALVTVEMIDEADGPRSQPDRRALAREGVRRLYAALAEQPAGGRIAFALHEIEGRSVAEVADITGASFTATKLRIWRTRRALMKQAAQDPILAEFLRDDAVEELS
jgi:RNA polymerase sigma-70 factor, ECF subfamily